MRRRLPLLISAVLGAVVLGVCFSAYRQLRVVLIGAAEQRILAATQQLGIALEQSVRTVEGDAQRIAADPAVVREFDGTAQSHEELRSLLARERLRAPQLGGLTLVRPSGSAFLTVDSSSAHSPAALRIAPEQRANPPLLPGIGPLVVSAGGAHYDVVTPVIRRGDTLGHLVLTRRTSAGTGGQLIGRLIGSDARLLFGNEGRGEWTDLERRVAGPPQMVPVGVASEYADPDGTRYLSAAVRLAATPWLVMVRIPRESVLAPARRFLVTIIAIGALLLLAGMLAAWRLSRQITGPLAEIAAAADGIASGDYTRRAPVGRRDELGSVAAAFNVMAEHVAATTTERMVRQVELESANRELRESEERYRRLVELLPDGIVVHRKGTILFGNAAAVRLFAADSAHAFPGTPFLELVAPADREEIADRIRYIEDERHTTPLVERTLRRLDGTSVSVETAGLPLTLGGESAVLTLVRDITQRKRLEEQMRQSQKMEAVGQLAGGVAHDFNNILTVIMSYSGLLLSSVEAASDTGRDLREINAAAQRAAGLTHQLLAFSRRQVLQPQLLDLNILAMRLESMLRRLLREDIELQHRFHPRLELVSADPGQVEQVIVNLAVNARDAMPNGGQLVIETDMVELDETSSMLPPGAAPGRFVVLAISDTGHGMDASTRAKIFDPFFTTKEPGKGTGLGLSTVYGIVQQSGGSISVYSEPGVGTTFKVYLPRAVGEKRDTPSTAPRAVTGGSETVLIVEDDDRVRAAAERVLVRAGYRVLLASTGADALTTLGEHGDAVGLVLADLVMPRMGGRQLATIIQDRWPDIEIVFMSGYTEDAASRSSVLAPGSHFLDKPFTPEGLTRKVREVLYGEADS